MKDKSALTVYIFAIIALALITNDARSECDSSCKKIKTAPYIEIRSSKQFLQFNRDMLVVNTKKIATQMGYKPYKACPGKKLKKPKVKLKCTPVVLSTRDAKFLCPSQIKVFSNLAKAEKKGLSPYTACNILEPLPSTSPSPTPTTAVTPIASSRTYTQESGVRINAADSTSVLKLSNGTIRAYFAKSSSSFDNETIYFADSADGLSFGSSSTITGITPISSATFARPSVVQLANGNFSLVYENVKHISSAGLDLHNLMRAVSTDGSSFSNQPANVLINNGSVISSNFDADVLKISDSTWRMYYNVASSLLMAESVDDGATWSAGQSVSITGNSSSYAPYPNSTSIIKQPDGSFLMFVVSVPNELSFYQSIYSAYSADGITFTFFDQPALLSSAELSLTDPNAIRLDDGSIRVYYVERENINGTFVSNLKSIISTP